MIDYKTAAIRRLLLAAFNDEEFTFFCYDHFREVYQKFGAGLTFTAKTHLLIEHCELRSEFTKLLPLIQEANPAKYAEFAPSLQKTPPANPPSPNLPILKPSLSLRQPFEPEMILIPAGEFLMGSDPLVDEYAQDDEQPQHLLYLPDYYLAKTLVTNAQFLAFVKATDYQTTTEQAGWGWVWTGETENIKGADWQHPSGPESQIAGKYDHPVVQVSWHDAVAYCSWLTEVTGKSYRLPSEAEWEKGARGTEGWIHPWGNAWEANRCNSYESESGDTTPVGAYPQGASPYELLDMTGNVWEWTRSLWGKDREEPDFRYPYRSGDGREAGQVEDKILRALRGGSWINLQDGTRCATRHRNYPNYSSYVIGFRVVSSI